MMENNEELIYFTACVVVMFNAKLNKQRFYTQHEQEIISCAVSNQSGDYIATGELGDTPKIHIWNSRTLENLIILSGIHKKGIHLMSFSKSDKYLISCGLKKPSAIVIYDWKNKTVLVSTTISSPTQDIFIFPDMYIDEKLREEEEPKNTNKAQAIEDVESEGDEEEKDVAIMGNQKAASQDSEKIVILSRLEITIFDLTSNSLNSHFISIHESEIKSEVL